MNPEEQLVLFAACLWLIVLMVFALPTLMAFRRCDPNRWLILAINASVVGWAVALAFSVCPLLRLGGLTGADQGAAGHHTASQSSPLQVVPTA